MKEIADEIRSAVRDAGPALACMKPELVSVKPGADRWSKKEMLGHLIDSAANNHQRFVRAGYGAAADFPPYSQNDWVRIQQYGKSEWADLVALWSAYNLHLCDVIERLPKESLSAPCNIGRADTVALEFVIRDYLRHLRHHLQAILPDKGGNA